VGRDISIVGLKETMRSSLVPTTPLGILLMRLAPLRMAILPTFDMPDLFERIEPASEAFAPGSWKRGGGAKSNPVNVLELRRVCLLQS
jgi:hypothetical protein